MIWQAIGGFIAGLVAGPAIIFGLSLVVYLFRENKSESAVAELHRQHTETIKDTKKRYQKAHDKYMKIREKVIRVADDLQEEAKTKESE
jgi:hypothetical protein